jgi:hypothetical protein
MRKEISRLVNEGNMVLADLLLKGPNVTSDRNPTKKIGGMYDKGNRNMRANRSGENQA